MAWRISSEGGKDQPKDASKHEDERLSGKSLEIAQQIVRDTLDADHQALERHAIIPACLPART